MLPRSQILEPNPVPKASSKNVPSLGTDTGSKNGVATENRFGDRSFVADGTVTRQVPGLCLQAVTLILGPISEKIEANFPYARTPGSDNPSVNRRLTHRSQTVGPSALLGPCSHALKKNPAHGSPETTSIPMSFAGMPTSQRTCHTDGCLFPHA